MIVVRDIKKLKLHNTAVSIGKFDGVHKGHDALLSELKKDPRKRVIITFEPMKGTPLDNPEHIFTEEKKIELLSSYDPDYIILYRFGKREASMSPKRFVRSVLVRKLGMKRIYAGTDFRFGRKGKGDINMLRSLSAKYGFEAVILDKIKYSGADISSTRIRNEIKAGHMDEAAAMLGRQPK